ncbi:unnamed protein product [Amaranthus hypochondriacus]
MIVVFWPLLFVFFLAFCSSALTCGLAARWCVRWETPFLAVLGVFVRLLNFPFWAGVLKVGGWCLGVVVEVFSAG